jgi:hypothetical protein
MSGWQYTFFDQADSFVTTTRFIAEIRNRLSPKTELDADELGVILDSDVLELIQSKALHDHIPHLYWNAAAAMYAYLYIELSKLGVDVVGESQLVGYPSQYPSVSMMDYVNNQPNSRYWVLKLLHDNFQPGDKLLSSQSDSSDIAAQAFATVRGRRVLLINKTDRVQTAVLPETFKATVSYAVDEATGDHPAKKCTLDGHLVRLAPFAVAVVQGQ